MQENGEPRVLVVGAGAIGGVIAAKLVRAGVRVVALENNEEHAALMRSPGLRVDDLGEEIVVPLDVVSQAEDLQTDFDIALVTLKAPYLEQAILPLVEQRRATLYVSLGNGLIQTRIGKMTGEGSLLAGTISWGATNLGPGHVAKTTSAHFVIGELSGEITDRLRMVAGLLEVVAPVDLTERIRGQVWSKLLLNSSFSGLGTVGGHLYEEVAAHPIGKELAFRVWTEGYDIAKELGLELEAVAGIEPGDLVVHQDSDLPRAELALKTLMCNIGRTKASMLQDIERGSPTEVHVINGGVVEACQAIGRTCPYNRAIVKIIRECEDKERRPGPRNYSYMQRVVVG